MRDLAMPKQSGEQCQGMECERLINERFLAFERLDRATGRKVVILIEADLTISGNSSSTVDSL